MIRRIGRYEITGKLGDGGFGSVYRGFDPSVERVVAIKVLANPGDQSIINRFRAEAMTAGNLNHKNIVTIYEFGEDNGMPFLAMEYLDGVDLRQIIKPDPGAEPLSLLEKLEIMSDAAQGLQCAHEHGVVHRDVKPANIMLLRDGAVKIMDFGIARLTNAVATRLTQTGSMIGTIPYMAPEQFRSGDVDALCDIWAYGVVLYELLTGINPFQAGEAPTTMYKITMEEPPPLSASVPGCPPALNDVVKRLLAKDRARRTQSLEDFLLDIDPVIRAVAQTEVPALLRRAERLIEAENLEAAQTALGRVLRLDRSHPEARRLRDRLRERARLHAIRPKIEALLREVEEHVGQRNFPAAFEKLNSAIRLDPESPTLHSRIERLRNDEERSKRAHDLITQGRRAITEGDLTGAFAFFSEAIEADPGNSQVPALLDEVKRAMRDREIEAQISAGMADANNLIFIQSYDEAIAVLSDLSQKHGANEQISRRLLEARQLKAAQDAKERLNAGINAARDLIRHAKYSEALASLEALNRDNPNNPAIEVLIAHVQERMRAEKIAQDIETLLAQARGHRSSGRLDQALQTVQQALALDRTNSKALALQRAWLDEAQAERDKRIVDGELNQFRALLNQNQLDDALAFIERAAADHPRDTRLTQAKSEVTARIRDREERRRQEIQKGIREAERLLADGRAGNATQLLANLTVQFPAEAAILDLMDRAQKLKSSQEAEERLNAGINAAKALLEKGEVEKGCKALEELNRQFPNAPGLEVLLAHARDQLRVKGISAQIDAFLNEAQKHHAAARYVEALSAVQKALDLDPSHPKALGIRRTIVDDQLADRNRRRIEEELRRIQALLQAQELDVALEVVETCAADFPLEPRFADLKREVKARIRQRDESRDREIRAGIEQAERLLANQRFAEAIELVEKLIARFPETTTFRVLRDRALEAKQSADDQGKFNAGLNAAKNLLKDGRSQQALAALLELDRQYPNNAAVDILLTHARQQAGEQEVAAEVGRLLHSAREQRSQGRLESALQLVEKALALDGAHKAALELRQTLLIEAAADRERKEVAAALAMCREHMQASRLDEALAVARPLAAKYPGNAEAAAACDRIAARIKERDEMRAREVRDRQAAEQAEIQGALSAADALVAKRDWVGAFEVIAGAQRKRPACPEYAEAARRIQFLQEQDQALSRVEAAVASGQLEQAISLAEAALTRYPGEPRAIAALQSARNTRELNDLLLYARRRLENGDLSEARQLIRDGRARFPHAPQWRELETQIESMAGLEESLREARRELNDRNFEKAVRIAQKLLAAFPENPAAAALLEEIGKRRQEHEQHQVYDSGRAEADRLARALNFDAAIAQINSLLALFPADPVLQRDLSRITTAQQEHLKREDYNRRRGQALHLSEQNQVNEAIAIIRALLQDFPGDSALAADLQSMEAALALREERGRIEAAIAELDALFRSGDAEAVRKKARQLLANHKEPRAAELLDWAERSIAQARDIRKQGRPARWTWIAAGALVCVIIIAAIFFFGHTVKPAEFAVEPADLTFSYQRNGALPKPESLRIRTGRPGQSWTVASSDAWLKLSQSQGTGSSSLTASVDPSGLTRGEYTAIATVSSESGQKALKVHLRVAGASAPPPSAAPEIKVVPEELAFSWERNSKASPRQSTPFQIAVSAGQRWTATAVDKWLSVSKNAGNGPLDDDLRIDASGLSAGDYTSIVKVASAVSSTSLIVRLHVTDAHPAQPIQQTQVQPPPPPPTRSVPPPVRSAPPVDCHAPGWSGVPTANMTWSGLLPPNGTLTIADDKTPSIGSLKGGHLQGCPVSISIQTSGVTVEEMPSESNNFHSLRLINKSDGPITSISITSQVK